MASIYNINKPVRNIINFNQNDERKLKLYLYTFIYMYISYNQNKSVKTANVNKYYNTLISLRKQQNKELQITKEEEKNDYFLIILKAIKELINDEENLINFKDFIKSYYIIINKMINNIRDEKKLNYEDIKYYLYDSSPILKEKHKSNYYTNGLVLYILINHFSIPFKNIYIDEYPSDEIIKVGNYVIITSDDGSYSGDQLSNILRYFMANGYLQHNYYVLVPFISTTAYETNEYFINRNYIYYYKIFLKVSDYIKLLFSPNIENNKNNIEIKLPSQLKIEYTKQPNLILPFFHNNDSNVKPSYISLYYDRTMLIMAHKTPDNHSLNYNFVKPQFYKDKTNYGINKQIGTKTIKKLNTIIKNNSDFPMYKYKIANINNHKTFINNLNNISKSNEINKDILNNYCFNFIKEKLYFNPKKSTKKNKNKSSQRKRQTKTIIRLNNGRFLLNNDYLQKYKIDLIVKNIIKSYKFSKVILFYDSIEDIKELIKNNIEITKI